MTRRAGRLALLAGLLAAFMLGCGGGDERSDADLRGVRLAAVIKGLDNPFFVTMRDGLVATARRDDARLGIAAAPTGLQDTAGQASELESLAADDPRCYVVNPINPTNLVGALARVAGGHAGRQRRLRDRSGGGEGGGRRDHHLHRHRQPRRRQARRGRHGGARRPRRQGRRDHRHPRRRRQRPARRRLQAQGNRGRFDVVATIAADFEREKARRAAADLLRADPRIDGFFAVNDLMALGVADAVQAAGRQGEVDGRRLRRHPAGARRRSGGARCRRPSPSTRTRWGSSPIEACLAALRGDSVPATVDAPVQVVTSENVARARANFPSPSSTSTTRSRDERPRSSLAGLAVGRRARRRRLRRRLEHARRAMAPASAS